MSDDEIFAARQLTARMVRGDANAISQFYDRFFHAMYREAQLASRRDEEFCLDVVQDSMLKVISNIRPMETFGQLEMWTRRLVRNVAYDQLRSEKHEVLNAFCVINERHLDHILHVSQDWYSFRRGHTEREHLPPVRDDGEPPVVDLAKHRIECHAELGGHLKSYQRAE